MVMCFCMQLRTFICISNPADNKQNNKSNVNLVTQLTCLSATGMPCLDIELLILEYLLIQKIDIQCIATNLIHTGII